MSLKTVEAALHTYARTFPEAVEDHPWGERVMKVNKKVFVFFGMQDNPDMLSMTVKLPHSQEAALVHPFASASGYGLGKHGWVTLRFSVGENPPLELLQDWILESYRAIAPKRLLAELEQIAV
jgi:predicted DNA-binding protein (MmcQ/YjbR family)